MKFEKTEVMNFKGAFRGLRNPLESWDKSDSFFGLRNFQEIEDQEFKWCTEDWTKIDVEDYDENSEHFKEHLIERENWLTENGFLNLNPIQKIANIAYIGPKDLNLAQRMIKAGTSDRKFMRQIFVSVDITAPLYWY